MKANSQTVNRPPRTSEATRPHSGPTSRPGGIARAKFSALFSGGLLFSAALLGGCEDDPAQSPGADGSPSTTTTTTVSASATMTTATSTSTGTGTSTQGGPADDSTVTDDSNVTVDDTMTDDSTVDDTTADDAMIDDSTTDDAMIDDSTVDDSTTDDAIGPDAGLEAGLPPLDYDAGDAGDAGPEAGPRDSGTPDAAIEAAVEASVEAEAGPEPEPEAGVPSSDLSVACTYPGSNANPLQMQLTFSNNSNNTIDMSNATVSYYFDDASAVSDLNLVVYSGPLGANASPSNVTGQVISNPNPTTGAGYIGQLLIGPGCPAWSPCTIAAGATTDALAIALTKSSGSFSTDQHYSFAPLQDDPCEFVVVEIGGEVVFGLPPATN